MRDLSPFRIRPYVAEGRAVGLEVVSIIVRPCHLIQCFCIEIDILHLGAPLEGIILDNFYGVGDGDRGHVRAALKGTRSDNPHTIGVNVRGNHEVAFRIQVT